MVYFLMLVLCYYCCMNKFISELESELTAYKLQELGLKENLDSLMLTNAKRIRPKLAWLLLKNFSEKITKEQIAVIAGGEILHTASLIHDDIVDLSTERRGVKTLNALYDQRLAVLAGDFLAGYGLQKILFAKNYEIFGIFCSAFEKMCTAEITQYFSSGKITGMEKYIQKSTGKTASLFGAILKSVAILSEKISPDIAYDLGIFYGTAFQIKNDLDAFINTPERDRNNGVFTAPDIYYSQTGNLNSAIEKTNILIDNEIGKLINIISSFPENNYKKQLIKMIEESLCRTINK